MNPYALVYLGIGLVASVAVSGWFYSYFQWKYPTIANITEGEDRGGALILGALSVLTWPVTVPLVFCLSGFAKHGCWRKFEDAK